MSISQISEASPPRVAEPAPSPDTFSVSPSLVVLSRPSSASAEAIRALRTHIMAQHIQEGRRALAVCAASGGAGCSFVAANLAVALSQAGLKTLLIDADMRQPKLDALFRPSRPQVGLMQCLASEDPSFGDSIQHEVLPNLSLMFSGGTPPNPQDLLAGTRFKPLVEFCLREFDATIVDTPAANTCADARRVSTVIGYSLIVARRDFTYVEDINTLAAQLESDHARVVGTVLNEG